MIIAASAVAIGLCGLIASPARATAGAPAASAHAVFDVTAYGATGDGTTNDAAAITAAVDGAAGAGGGIVEFPAGSYLVGATVHLKSNVIIQLDSGSTLTGASSGYDAPEPNPNDAYQDFGHSHFHDAMFYGDGLSNIGFTGSGTIDGGDNFITGNPKPGQADKLISLTRCTNLTMNGITLKRGGHFAILINGCDGVTSDHLNIQTADDRDGWNVINTRDATFNNITIAANDDALVFKSDWALGQRFVQGDVSVNNAHLSAKCCNALMFGSETCSDFAHYNFSHITITAAGKSGLGLVSMDGANISDVHYNDVTMSGTASPIMIKIGTRKRCGDSPGIGSISDVTFNNVTGTGAGAYSPTIWGQPGHPVSGITFNNVGLTVPGGHGPMSIGVPSDNGDYNPNSIGTRPAYGWYLHNVDGITFNNATLHTDSPDGRPAFLADAAANVRLNNATVEAGDASPFDLGFLGSTFCVNNARTTSATAARIDSDAAATVTCRRPANDFSIGVTPGGQSVPAGTAATYTVDTAVLSGHPGTVTLAASNLPLGATASFDPATVASGGSSTLTVTGPPGGPGASATMTVTGTSGTTMHSANADLTIVPVHTGGGIVSDLSVADTANAADWSVQDNLQVGDVLYGDRTFTVASLPPALVGAQWIRTANDSKTATVDPLATFTLSQPSTVYIGVDTRVGRRPFMDSGWVATGTQLTDTEGSSTRHFDLYQKTFPAGQVALGPEADTANSGSMYLMAIG
jgi:polygalacturonase